MHDRSFITTGDGTRIAYRLDGPTDSPVLVLSNSIGTTLNMWDGQIPDLVRHFRVLRYDTRGHGASDAPSGPYSFDRMGQDVLELLDALSIDRAHFCGISFGGLVGQWLGTHTPERINRLILANTSPYLGPPEQWDAQISTILQLEDMSTIADIFLKNWFPQHMLAEEKGIIAPFREVLLSMSPQGFAGCFAAIRDADMRETNALIPNPTLVIAGEHDTVCLPSHGELIAATIPGAQYASLPVVHLSNVENPTEFLSAVYTFLLKDSALL